MAARRARAVRTERDAARAGEARRLEWEDAAAKDRLAAYYETMGRELEDAGGKGPSEGGSDDADSIGPDAVARYLEDARGSGSAGAGPSGLRKDLEPCATGVAHSRGFDGGWRHDREADGRAAAWR